MLLTKKVLLKWSRTNKNHLIKKGYQFTKIHDNISVDVKDILNNSPALVEVKCDYCDAILKKTYQNYTQRKKNLLVKKDCCENCEPIRRKENIELKQLLGLLKRSERGYWNFYENLQKEIKHYMEMYNNLDNIQGNKWGRKIYNSSFKLGVNPYDIALSIGYRYLDVFNRFPKGYINSFDRLTNIINEFIEKHNHFPSQSEFIYELNIGSGVLKKHGGVDGIKRKMGYYNNGDLVDNRGDVNKSSYELIVANFLIANGLKDKYKREQYPFKNERYRSDFTLYASEKEIHIEVWGLSGKNDNSKRSKLYLDTKQKKLDLYKNYDNITLISIEPYIFKGSYDKISNNLRSLLSNHLNINLQNIGYTQLLNHNSLTNEELLEICLDMSYSNDVLPKQSTIIKNNYGIYTEISKRFNNYQEFASYYNKGVPYSSNNYWSLEEITDRLRYIEENHCKICHLTTSYLKKPEDSYLNGLLTALYKFGGLINAKLHYYLHCLEELEHLSNEDIFYVQKISEGKHMGRKVDKEQIDMARRVLNLIYNNKEENK